MSLKFPARRWRPFTFCQALTFDRLPAEIIERVFFAVEEGYLYDYLTLNKAISRIACGRPLYHSIDVSDRNVYKLLEAVLAKPRKGKWIRTLIIYNIWDKGRNGIEVAIAASHLLMLLRYTPNLQRSRIPPMPPQLQRQWTDVLATHASLQHIFIEGLSRVPTGSEDFSMQHVWTLSAVKPLRSLSLQAIKYTAAPSIEVQQQATSNLTELYLLQVPWSHLEIDLFLSLSSSLTFLAITTSLATGQITHGQVISTIRTSCSALRHLELSTQSTTPLSPNEDDEIWEWLKDFKLLISLKLSGPWINATSLWSITSPELIALCLHACHVPTPALVSCIERNAQLKYLRFPNERWWDTSGPVSPDLAYLIVSSDLAADITYLTRQQKLASIRKVDYSNIPWDMSEDKVWEAMYRDYVWWDYVCELCAADSRVGSEHARNRAIRRGTRLTVS